MSGSRSCSSPVAEGPVFHCHDCMPYEDGCAVWIARGLRTPIAELWPRLEHCI